MESVKHFVEVELTGELKADIKAFFIANLKPELYIHSKRAMKKGRKLAKMCELPKRILDVPLLLHDIGRVVPKEQAVFFLAEHNIAADPLEVAHPGILHGQVSVVLAQEVFNINDPELLDAIRYHTTMRPNPTLMDKLVFLSDKLSWTDDAEAELVKSMKKASKKSIEAAIFVSWLVY